jgi:RNA polymerase sigma-70 factor (ECF subfamily)
MLGSIEAAEDITHECFLSLIVRADRFDPTRASLRTYLLAAARNLSFKHLRKYGGEVTVEEMSQDARLSFDEAPLHKLISEERARQVRNAISNLPPLQREVVILFQYEELSLAEISSVVGADIGTVKSRLHRAREGLRRSLASYFKSDSAVVIEGSY